MGEKKYKYTTRINQPQKVVGITLNAKEGVITEKELKALKKDAYGASLLEKGLLVVEEAVVEEATTSNTSTAEEIPEIKEG